MKTTLQKWGNSQGIRLPKSLIDQAGMAVGEEVQISLCDSKTEITIRATAPSRPIRGRYNIDDLVAAIEPGAHDGDVGFGVPEGQEVW